MNIDISEIHELILRTAEEARREGYKEGRDDGYDEGYDDAMFEAGVTYDSE